MAKALFFLVLLSLPVVAQPEKINEHWSFNCSYDQVADVRRCWVGTFGGNYPLQVYFLNGGGPYILVGHHNFPGRSPLVRIDDNAPIGLQGDSIFTAPADLIAQMKVGTTLRARFHVWPSGPKDMVVALDGFGEAWERLQAAANQNIKEPKK